MKRLTTAVAVILIAGLADVADAGKYNVREMSDEQLVKLALSAAPKSVAEGAKVVLSEEDGSSRVLREGDNGFTCLPFIDPTVPGPDPVCLDGPALQWAGDMMSGADAPTNTAPGVAYMARGGFHWEKDGQVVMHGGDDAKPVKESPHWMIMFPFDPQVNGLPTEPSKKGTWVMWGNTPWSHLMVHQDPRKLK